MLFAAVTGLAAAAAYGAGDFLGGFATKRTSVGAVAFGAQLTGAVLLLLVLPFAEGSPSPAVALWGAAAGLCGAAGMALLYHALAIGKMGVISPVTAVLAAGLPAIAGVLHGEHPSTLRLCGMAIALLAVVMISLSAEEDGTLELSTRGVKEAVLAGVFFGAFFIVLGFAPAQGGFYPLLFARISSCAVIAVTALIARTRIWPQREARIVIVGAGVLDMTANMLYVATAHIGGVAVAAVLTSLYPASTVILAFVVLRERLRSWQTAGLLLAVTGVALIAA